MANRAKGEVGFRGLDGADYVLVYDVNALCDAEDRLGFGVGDFGARLASPSVSQLRVLLWAGLRARHPEIDERAAGALLSPKRLGAVVTEALAAALPQAEGESDDADPR